MSLFTPAFAASTTPSSTERTIPTLAPSSGKVHTLKNGLTVIINVDHSAPVVSLQAWCGTGSIHEGKWLGAGLSHILEHMLFKGTKTRGAGEIARSIQDQGGYINAYTSFDRTVYWIDTPASGTKKSLEILCDAMMNSTLPEEPYAKEQEVIRREFAMGFDDPGRQGIELLLRTLYPNSPYGLPVIGHLDIFNQLTRDDVMEYYRSRYVPNNLTFVIAGDVNEEEVLAQLTAFFADYPRGKLAPVLIPDEAPQLGRREAHEEFPTELTRMFMAWPIPGMADPDAPALEVLGSILGSGRSAILNREIRERKNLVHAISAGVYTMHKDGVFFISAVCDPEKRNAVEKETLAMIAQIQKKGVDEESLKKARQVMLSELLQSLTTARGKASSDGSNWLLARNLNFGADFLRSIATVSAKQVQEVACKYLVNDKVTVTSLNPIGSLTQNTTTISNDEKAPVQKFELPNGLRLLVREDHRLPLVSMTAAFRGGVLAETEENNGITALLTNTLPKGTTTRSAEKIADLVEGVGGSIGASGGNNTYAVSVSVMQPDLRLGLELLADVLQNPSFPEKEIQLEKSAQIASIKAEDDSITATASKNLRKILFAGHPFALRRNGSAESVEKLTRQGLMDFHKKYTVGKNGVLAVFGDVKTEEVLALVKKLFGSMPAGDLGLANAEESKVLTERITTLKEMDKQQAVVMVGYRGASVNSPDIPALELISSASSDLGSRFFDRIREQMGLAYYVGASQMTGLAPGSFIFYVGTDPTKVEPVTAALNEEIGKLAAEGLTEAELERAKQKLLGDEAIHNQSNAAFSAACAMNELVGLGYDYSLRRPAEIKAVTLEQTKEISQRYFQKASPVEVTVRPPKPAQK